MEKFKKVLVSENNDLLEKITNQVNDYNPHLKRVKESYEALELGGFTHVKYIQLISHGIKQTEIEYKDFLNSELDKLGLTSTVIKNNLLNASKDNISTLGAALNNLKSFRIRPSSVGPQIPVLPLDFVFYSERAGTFYVNDEKEAELNEMYCKTYLNDVEEQKAYKAIIKIVDAYNEFLELPTVVSSNNFRFVGLDTLRRFIVDPVIMKKHDETYDKKAFVDSEMFISFIRFEMK